MLVVDEGVTERVDAFAVHDGVEVSGARLVLKRSARPRPYCMSALILHQSFWQHALIQVVIATDLFSGELGRGQFGWEEDAEEEDMHGDQRPIGIYSRLMLPERALCL